MRLFGRKNRRDQGQKALKKLIPFFCAILSASPLLGVEDSAPPSAEEVVALRKITEFWKDEDYKKAATQIEEFFTHYPHSSLKSYLYAMQGDLLLQQGKYQEALLSYEKIKEPLSKEGKPPFLFSKLHCLFALERYQEAADLAEILLSSPSPNSTEIQLFLAKALEKQAVSTTDIEQKKALLIKAKEQFLKLSTSSYQDEILLPLAQVYHELGEEETAATTYFLLAEKHPQEKEDYLFQAGLATSHFDKAKAIQTFTEVASLEGKNASEALYNKILLLFELEQFQDIVSCKPFLEGSLPQDKKLALQFYLGKSYYALGDYPQALACLQNYLSSVDLSKKDLLTEDQKELILNALLTSLDCAYKEKNLSSLEHSLKTLQEVFPEEKQLAQALLLHAQLCMEKQDKKRAEKDLEEMTKLQTQEELLYDYALLLGENKKWEESRGVFLDFLKKFPASSHRQEAWRHLINSSRQKNETSSEKTKASGYKKELLSDIQSALNQLEALSKEEEKEYRLFLILGLYELERYGEALGELQQYIQDYEPKEGQDKTGSKEISQAYLLMGFCYEALSSPERALPSLQKAVSLNPDLLQSSGLHLHLYNTYLGLAQKEASEAQKALLEKAAHHLFTGYKSGNHPLKVDNHLWLAHHYYTKAKQAAMKGDTPTEEDLEHTIFLLENLLKDPNGATSTALPKDPLLWEKEILMCADALGMAHKTEQKISLLQALVAEEQKNSLNWKYPRQAILELALTYEATGEEEKALSLYNSLLPAREDSSLLTSPISSMALLHKTRLDYKHLNPSKKNSEDPECNAILSHLKDLQMQKKLYSEPAHLEAGLDYAYIQAFLSPTEQKGEKELFFIKRLEEDFLSEETTKNYQEAQGHFPEKYLLVQKYLQFIGLEKTRLELNLSGKKGKKYSLLGQKKQLASQFKKLSEESLPPDLAKRVAQSITAIEKSL